MQNADRSKTYSRRLALMVELCNSANTIAEQMIEREEQLDMLKAFEDALKICLKRNNYDKDDLVTVWAMLQLGSRAIRTVSLSTEDFHLNTAFDPASLLHNSKDSRHTR